MGGMLVRLTYSQMWGGGFRSVLWNKKICTTSERNFVKLNTLDTGVRIFNGAVQTEREFPLKILSLACIQGVVVLLFYGTEFIISSSDLRIRFCFALYPDVFIGIPNHSS